jgi:hypothetical protein
MLLALDPAALLVAAACMALVFVGAAIQVAVGAGLSVVCGSFLLLWLGAAIGVPTLLCLNLLVSVVATAFGGTSVRWGDVVLASGATLAGCGAASVLPSFPEPVLKEMTACVLVAVALPRPPVPGVLPSEASARVGISLAALMTGALTVWTATPGPITPVAMARGGRSGADIRRTMQPVSVAGYGAALVWGGTPRIDIVGAGVFAGLIAAALLGTGAGFFLRPKINPARVVLLIRVVAGAATVLLLLSLFR